MKRQIAVALFSTAYLAVSSPGAIVQYTLDPVASTLSVTGTFAGATLEPQTPGSATTGFTGVFQGDRTGNTLSIETTYPRSVSQPVPQLPGGFEGDGGSSFGLRGISPTLGPLLVSLSPLQFYISTEYTQPLPAGEMGFAATDFGFFLGDGAIYYSANGTPRSYIDLHGYGAPNRSTRRGTLTTAGDVETLTLPIETTFSPFSNEDITLTFVGQFVAHRTIPEPSCALLLAFGVVCLSRRARH